MNKINEHPILDIPQAEEVVFEYNGLKVTGYKGYTIAAALHQAGFEPVYSPKSLNIFNSSECFIR